MRKIPLLFFIVTLIFLYNVDTEASEVTGFRVADWGMSRNEIIAAEGPPDAVGDGYIMYFVKIVRGKKAGVVYNFEKGCTSLKTSTCRFSDGYYSFHDGSKEFSDELEKILTEKYGAPIKTEKEIETISDSDFVKEGKQVKEYTRHVRYAEKIKIAHYRTVNLYDYTDVTGELHKAGPLRNFVHYYGPYHYKIERNKKRAAERERRF
jgi:hypothetical protein